MPAVLRLFIDWFLSPKPLLAAALTSVFVVSAIGVAYSAHETRNMYRDLQQLEKSHDDLEHEYEKLLLEQSAWADYTRLNELAFKELEMQAPEADDLVVLR
ncbi:MAG: cell division protein FtsL [Pseudomonadales bacterium]|nr:cell division protein FtsL [Pseudomonadales bacterium]MBO6564617.1 cell division protein FtsL [Pseudomonadales bacterium]MBO6594255.1 cell division protein FtsL [Pseudomonadales bacterium]MBO6656282.1 cell division protein FtsL [Pseudomonadales bacterium]MBO6700754.1 cell division protein FtsL [Pseudomonadales bacterium]